MTMYYVYMLHSVSHDEIYTGYTTDLKARFRQHNQGKSVHTNKFKPWELTTYIAFSDKKKARNFERYLKTGSGIAFARKRFL